MENLHDVPSSVSLNSPPLWFWVRAGAAFTLGAGVVTLIGQILWWLFVANMITGMARVLSHR
jgi:hypothetical protein